MSDFPGSDVRRGPGVLGVDFLEFLYQRYESKLMFFDTETTGLDHTAEFIEIAIQDAAGRAWENSLCRPVGPISPQALQVNGLLEEEVRSAPIPGAPFFRSLDSKFHTSIMIGWNVGFDLRIVVQTAAAREAQMRFSFSAVLDLMLTVSEDLQLPSKWGGYKWLKLIEAAQLLGVPPAADLHRALADTDLTRRIFLKVAGAPEERWNL
jgi:DNA polymerase III subunit epsilon